MAELFEKELCAMMVAAGGAVVPAASNAPAMAQALVDKLVDVFEGEKDKLWSLPWMKEARAALTEVRSH